MNTDEHGYFDRLTEQVLGAVFEVSNSLGAGFLEKGYNVLCSMSCAFAASGLLPKSHFQ